jgi:hypothetical protein
LTHWKDRDYSNGKRKNNTRTGRGKGAMLGQD